MQCAQILISMSRTINPFYLGTLPKAMANLCRGSSKYNRRYRDDFDISSDTLPTVERVQKVHKSSAHSEDGNSYGWTTLSIKS